MGQAIVGSKPDRLERLYRIDSRIDYRLLRYDRMGHVWHSSKQMAILFERSERIAKAIEELEGGQS